MNKMFFLLALLIVASSCAMNEPEGPEKWRRIALGDLAREALLIEANRYAKNQFIQEARISFKRTLDLIQDLAIKFPEIIKIDDDIIIKKGNEKIRMSKDWRDYTQEDMITLMEHTINVIFTHETTESKS